MFAALHAVAAPKQVRLVPKAVHGGALEPYQPPARTDDWEPLSIGTGGPPETPAYQACQDQGTSSGAPSLGWIWSFPGSGNTVTRLLLDAASGYMTGSVYNDTSLVGGLAGEALDAQSANAAGELTLIKTHTFQGEHASKGTACIGCGQRPQGLLPSPQEWPMVKRAAALTREPYAAILAEYARQTTGCHTCILERIDDWVDFQDKARRLAAFWQAVNEKQLHCVKGFAQGANAYSCASSTLVKLEDLLLADDRVDHLHALVAFAGIDASEERLRCAFAHAETYHRTGSITVQETFCSEHVSPAFRSDLAAILEGAAQLGYSPLDCDHVQDHQKEIYSLQVP